MGKFWNKRKEDYFYPKGTGSFFEWIVGKDMFSLPLTSQEQTQKLLIEIQKRSLADQVLVLSRDMSQKHCTVLGISPLKDKPIIHPPLQLSLMNICREEKRILLWEDLWDDKLVGKQLKDSKCDSLLLSPLTLDENLVDALLIVNYSHASQSSRIIDFITFISTVLSLSIQNIRLFSELERKDTELKEWITHVEKRIEAGTKLLLEKEFQYYTLFEETNDAIVVHHVDGEIIEVNQAISELLGYEKNELLNLNWSRLCPSEISNEHISFFKRILNREGLTHKETVMQKKDGTVFQAELNSRRMWFRGKEVIQSVIRDISKRKKLEESLRETKGKYRILLDSSQVGVFVIQSGIIQYVNSMFEKIIGYSEDELLDNNFFNFIAPEDRNMVLDREVRREKSEYVPAIYEMRLLNKRGQTCWVEVHFSCVVLDGKATILGQVIDMQQRKYLETQRFEIQKMESITTLAGGVAHDFNNLLGGILGYASLILSDMPKDNVYYDDIQVIAETAKKAADLTSRLLAFARGGKYQVKSVNINRIIEDVISVLSRIVDSSIIIEKSLGPSLWQIQGDSQQIYDVIFNICLNARDAMQNGGKISIETINRIVYKKFAEIHSELKPGDYVCITISDTGKGMSEAVKSRIFEPFFTTKLARNGAGLGLAMAYGVVKNHEGVIFVDSELKKGTKITIYFPRYVKERQVVKKLRTSHSKAVHTILLVDDEEVIRQVGKRMLEKGGYAVLLANDGQDAIKIFEKQKETIDLVLLDLIMPVMGGKETHRRLQEIDPDVLVIFTSGYGPYSRTDFNYLGNEYFIQKPFQTEVLIQAIREFIGMPQKKI